MQFWRFIGPETKLGTVLEGRYEPFLLTISVVVACLAGYAALSVVDRIVASRTQKLKRIWLTVGAAAMGCGIWAMHFTGMLAFTLPMPNEYSGWLTFISVIPAILGSGIALHFMARERVTWIDLQISGLLMAVGIGSMHYIGMEAMAMGDALHYNLPLFCLSILVAHILATISLYIKVVLKRSGAAGMFFKTNAAIVMGLAVSGMHYTAMAAATFTDSPDHIMKLGALSPLAMGTSIVVVTVCILTLAILGTLVDRRLDEAALSLQKSEDWSRLLVDNSSDGIFSADAQGKIMAFNRAAELMFGFSAAEVIGQSVNILIPPEEPKPDDDPFAALLSEREGQSDGSYSEVNARRKDGTAFSMELGVAEFKTDDGRFFLGSMRDITSRKSMMNQLAHAQKLESIGQLAAGIAHEINTPIQFIGDNTKFLKDAFGDVTVILQLYQELIDAAESGSISPELLDKARKAAALADIPYLTKDIPPSIMQSLNGLERVAKIVLAMKQFSHPGHEEKQSISLHELIESTLIVSRNEWKYVADVDTDYDPDLPNVACYPGEFNQVILNMIVNSSHSIKEALGEEFEKKGKILIRTRLRKQFAEVQIVDSGKGIPREIQSRVFDPFFTTKEVGQGTGQGLSIAHSVIVKKHKGKLFLESEPGKGATFTIQLPLEAGV